MSGRDPAAVIQNIQVLFGAGAVGGLTDVQLLERFVVRRDPDAGAEAAFSALVKRHGPMVWGVCRRFLNDSHEAEDAFQATFLVLARSARKVRVNDSLAPWLYGVSRKVAARARSTAAQRTARECGGVERLPAKARSDHAEFLSVLDEEIARLPERYRAAVVLCDLEGESHEKAARQLGCAVGTVGSRLSRARERLRDRLTRRGLAPSAVPLTAWLPTVAPAPTPLIDSTTRLGLQVAAGEAAAVSTNVSLLTTGVIKAMFLSKLTFAAALAAPTAAALFAIAQGAASTPQAPPATAPETTTAPRRAAEPELSSLQAVLAKTIKTYADARSYADEGEVALVFHSSAGKRTVKRPFSTRYVRPNLFRYEFSEYGGDGEGEQKRYVIWSDAAPERSKRWWTIQPEVKEAPLATAVASGNGISGGSALTIPALLIPDAIKANSLAALKDLKLAAEEALDGSTCLKIEGKNARGDVETVWIDKATSLVRKIRTALKIPEGTVDQTTTYRARLNVELLPDQFGFTPPKPQVAAPAKSED